MPNYLQMGSLFSLLASLSELKAKVMLLGLDSAGKTTILYKLKLDEVVTSVPTIGFNVEEVSYKNLKFTIWDIGGQTKLRGLWHHYYANSNALIYVLDSSDEERFQMARQTMMGVLDSPQMENVPVLVFANKMDVTRRMAGQLVEKMGLHQLRRRSWHLQPCCALNGEGLAEGFQWLHNELKKRPSK